LLLVGCPQHLLILQTCIRNETHEHPIAAEQGISGIEVYGAGKGKSTSALGKALQAIGRGISQDQSHRVLIMQWL